jgi:uncharacterized membrane protein
MARFEDFQPAAPREPDWLDDVAARVQTAVRDAVDRADGGASDAVRWLRGEPLGYPAHPMLVDLAGAYWTSSITLDLLGALGFKRFRAAADMTLALGMLSSLPTVASGLADFAEVPPRSRRRAAIHACLAVSGTVLYGASLLLRMFGRRRLAFVASSAASALAIQAAGQGGALVFRHGVGQRGRARDGDAVVPAVENV